MLVGQGGQGFDVGHFTQRIGWGFQKQHLGIGLYRRFPSRQIHRADTRHFNAITWQHIVNHRAGRAKQAVAREQMVAILQ